MERARAKGVIVCFLLLAACAHAKLTEYSISAPTTEAYMKGAVTIHGEIELSGPFMPSMRKAHEIMLNFCDGPYMYQETDSNPVSKLEFQCR